MESLEAQYTSLVEAVDSLQDAIALHEEILKEKYDYDLQFSLSDDDPIAHTHDLKRVSRLERLIKATRDSVIQRFEYSIDQLCKHLKNYMEKEGTANPELQSPRGIIRLAGKIKLLSEQETETALEMIDSRNRTSHLYREEVAQIVADAAQIYYQLIRTILTKIKPMTKV